MFGSKFDLAARLTSIPIIHISSLRIEDLETQIHHAEDLPARL
jgi:hypothetical protein